MYTHIFQIISESNAAVGMGEDVKVYEMEVNKSFHDNRREKQGMRTTT